MEGNSGESEPDERTIRRETKKTNSTFNIMSIDPVEGAIDLAHLIGFNST